MGNWKDLELKFELMGFKDKYKGKGEPIFSQGNKEAKIMLIFPEIDDEALLNYDIYASALSEKMKVLLEFYNLNIDNIYTSSLYKLDKKYIKITKEEYLELIDILISEIELLKPEYILTIGQEVFNVLISDKHNLDVFKTNVDVNKHLIDSFEYFGVELIPLVDLERLLNLSKEEKILIKNMLRRINK